ncbi:MAG: hypothetical protein AMJ62_08670 [Myxococcales bacterium SG8_38]|nr:MAG: hypothetical protein AMJ62_08670 [Myxococcales bacterium SG8_38]
MPSPAHAAELDRLLWRAAEECESKEAWFGAGLPQLLRRTVEAEEAEDHARSPDVAFVEVSAVSPQGSANTSEAPPSATCPVIALSTTGLEGLSSLIRSTGSGGVRVSRLICPVAVFDFTAEGVRVREIRHGLTAADLQRRLSVPLWAGPDLKELGTH